MKRIRLRVPEPAGVDRSAWPVTMGVPFAEGDLPAGRPVRLIDADGAVLPLQTRCLTTWRADRKDVKWLLLDFQAELKAGQPREYFLEYGDGVAAGPDGPIAVEDLDKGRVRIDTGALRMDLRTAGDRKHPQRNGRFIEALCVRSGDAWRDMLGPAGLVLYMADREGQEYASAPAKHPSVRIEQRGGLHVVVAVRGEHASAGGAMFCPYLLRMHLFAGRADVRLEHTFIFDRDPDRVALSAIGVRIGVDGGDEPELAVGSASPRNAAGGLLEIRHTTHQDHVVRRDGRQIAQGGRVRAWAAVRGGEASALAVFRHPWQEYPKALAVGPQQIEVQIWPASHPQPLTFDTPFKETAIRFSTEQDEDDFRRRCQENPTAPLNLKSTAAFSREHIEWVERMVEKYAPGRAASYNDTGTSDGYGAAKTTEFWLSFGPAGDAEAEAFATCVQEPLIGWADGEHAAATGALRVLAAYDPQRFGEEEQALEKFFDMVVTEPRKRLGCYGMIDYGDLMCSHSGSPEHIWRNYKDDPNVDLVHKMRWCARSYNNEANDQVYALWCLAAHTQKRGHFLAAQAYGRHMADVDICHASANRDGYWPRGLMHYHNCHHWTGGTSPSHTCMAGLMLQYYLTGEARIFDVCREIAEGVFECQEPAGIYSNRYGTLIRETTTPIANLLEFYQATWDARFGWLARRTLKWLLLAQETPGAFPLSLYSGGQFGDEAFVENAGWCVRQAGGMTPQMLYDAACVWPDEPIFREALVNFVDRMMRGPEQPGVTYWEVGPRRIHCFDPLMNASMVAYAYRLTGDPVYAAYGRAYLKNVFLPEARYHQSPRSAEEDAKPRPWRFGLFTLVCWGSLAPPLMQALQEAEESHGRETVDRCEREWIEWVEQEFGGQERPAVAGSVDRERRSLGRITGYED